MKTNLKLIVGAALVLSTVTFFACNKEAKKDDSTVVDTKNSAQTVLTNDCKPCGSQRTYVPIRNTIITNLNKSLTITNAKSVVYLGTDVDGNPVAVQAGGTTKLTCTCNAGAGSAGCFPSITTTKPMTFACVQSGDCTDCSQKLATSLAKQIKSGGFVDFSEGISIAPRYAELPGAFEELYLSPEYDIAMNAFITKYNGGLPLPRGTFNANGELVAPTGYVITLLNVFGRGVAAAVPLKAVGNILNFDPQSIITGGPKASCSSCGGDGACTLTARENNGGTSTYSCMGCNGCTLTVNAAFKIRNPITKLIQELTYVQRAYQYKL